MRDTEIIATIRNKYQALRPVMDEKVCRRWAACEAMAIGWGGITAVAEATGLSRPTIRTGIAEVQGGVSRAEEADQTEALRVRRGGGGRRRVTDHDRTLLQDLGYPQKAGHFLSSMTYRHGRLPLARPGQLIDLG